MSDYGSPEAMMGEEPLMDVSTEAFYEMNTQVVEDMNTTTDAYSENYSSTSPSDDSSSEPSDSSSSDTEDTSSEDSSSTSPSDDSSPQPSDDPISGATVSPPSPQQPIEDKYKTVTTTITRYDGSKVVVKAELYLNGLLHAVTTAYVSGALKMEAFYHDDGETLRFVVNYASSGNKTQSSRYYKNGKLAQRTDYIDGLLGHSVQYYESGKMMRDMQYYAWFHHLDNPRGGPAGNVLVHDDWYYEDGTIKQKSRYADNGFAKELSYYYPDGGLRSQELYDWNPVTGERFLDKWIYNFEESHRRIEIVLDETATNYKIFIYDTSRHDTSGRPILLKQFEVDFETHKNGPSFHYLEDGNPWDDEFC
jgi:antitoxin component YwqK of YwqJK toxin-antitoxin module